MVIKVVDSKSGDVEKYWIGIGTDFQISQAFKVKLV